MRSLGYGKEEEGRCKGEKKVAAVNNCGRRARSLRLRSSKVLFFKTVGVQERGIISISARPPTVRRIASAPACPLPRSSCAKLSRVKSKTGREGTSFFISRVASDPFITGIRKSMTAKSRKHS